VYFEKEIVGCDRFDFIFYFLFRINCFSHLFAHGCLSSAHFYILVAFFETGFLQRLFEIVIVALYIFKSLY
jgi:hypothetical protein